MFYWQWVSVAMEIHFHVFLLKYKVIIGCFIDDVCWLLWKHISMYFR